tara:strand:+ start:264 stop:1409 length:1146 start_codon:yes stop_codon:yes gene_type:complete
MKILFCATHYSLNTGYAEVACRIINYLAEQGHTIYYVAIQSPPNPATDRSLNANVHVLEQEEFGYENVLAYNQAFRPDVILVYSDVVVCAHYVNKLKTVDKTFKLILYQDITYKWQNYIPHLNSLADKFVCFNKFWESHLVEMGVSADKITTIEHPVEVPEEVCQPSTDDFIVLNFNRNTYRKRLDITIDGFIKFFLRNNCDPSLKLFIKWSDEDKSGINVRNTAVALARDNGLNDEQTETLMNKSIIGHTGYDLNSEEVWEIYMMGHVGINTSSGEGFGLCSINHQLCGRPQILSDIGTNRELFNKDWCTLLPIRSRIMLSKSDDNVGGMQELVSSDDVAEAIDFYYKNPEIRERHGSIGQQYFHAKESPLAKWNKTIRH